MRKVYSCHRYRIHACSAVQTPHSSMQLGTHGTMPYLLPRAAPTGCSVTKKAKKRATAVLRSPLSSPMSVVKCADSAFPICEACCQLLLGAALCQPVIRTLDLSSALKRNSSARNGSRRQSSFRTVLLCTLGSTTYGSSTSSGGIACRAVCDGARTGASSKDSSPSILSVAKRAHHKAGSCIV
jgi:hypothetical protein